MSNISCVCTMFEHSTDLDLAAARDRRHHPACPLHTTEKHPRLFYYEESENAWTPVPQMVENIVEVNSLDPEDDEIEIRFRRYDMTDEEFYNLPED